MGFGIHDFWRGLASLKTQPGLSHLDNFYETSTLPHSPNPCNHKALMRLCVNPDFYGSL